MSWATVADFLASKTYATTTEFHGWAQTKVAKFVSAFASVYARAKRNGADDAKANSLAWTVAYSVAKRAASEETVSRAEKNVHYFAAMAPLQNARNFDGTEVTGEEYKFTLLNTSLPLLKSLAAGLAFNWDHEHGSQVGVIHDIILRENVPPEVQAAMDPDIPFLYVASYRSDVSEEARKEVRISPEWLVLDGNEALPLTFAATHTPLNDKETGIGRVAASPAPLAEPVAPAEVTEVAATIVEAPPQIAQPHYCQPGTAMADPPNPTQASMPEVFETKLAALNNELGEEKKSRKVAELNYAAMKAEFETTKRVIEELKAAATEQMADMAALSLVHDGKATADQASYFAALYKKMGREEFETLVAALPRTLLGAYAIKAAAQVIQSPEQMKAHRDRLASLLREA